jgi:hypothetical protein
MIFLFAFVGHDKNLFRMRGNKRVRNPAKRTSKEGEKSAISFHSLSPTFGGGGEGGSVLQVMRHSYVSIAHARGGEMKGASNRGA